ncbi:MAG: hypothetical protein QXU97_02290 [Fervidicoccaceae archaeon]
MLAAEDDEVSCEEGHLIIDETRGELICSSTGEIVSRVVDLGPEWREFSSEDRMARSRQGSARTNLVHDHGLSSIIDYRDVDRLAPTKRFEGRRLQRLQMASRVAGHRRLVRSLQIVKREGEKLGLPRRTLETAGVMMRRIISKGLGRGAMLSAYVAAALYASSRVTGVPRPFYEVANSIGVPLERARYAYKRLVELEGGKIEAKIYKPSDYVAKVSSVLGFSSETERLMYRLARAAEKLGLVHGKSPTAVAAAVAYIAGGVLGEKRDQKTVARSLGGFTDVAVRNRYRELIDRLYIEVSL